MSNTLSPDKRRLLSADKTAETIQIENGVVTICSEAFDSVKAIDVVLPEGVEKLEVNAFLRAHKLKSIQIPSSLKTIGDYAFRFCDSLERIELGPDTEYLGSGAFYGCDSLREIVLNGVFNWESNWISGLSPFAYLKSITKIESHNSNFIVYDDMLFSADKKILFRCPVNKTMVTLPKELEVISNYAFYNCRYLQGINIPEGVKHIGCDAFGCCSSLREIRLPDSLTEIQNDTFSLCRELSYIQFPQNLSNIYEDAFFGCSKLEFFYFPPKKEKEIRGMLEASGFEYVVHSPLAYTEMANSICLDIKLNQYDELREKLSDDCQLISLGQETISGVDQIVSFLKKNLRPREGKSVKIEKVDVKVKLSESYQRDCIEVLRTYEKDDYTGFSTWYILFTIKDEKISRIICGDIYIHQRKSEKHPWEDIQKQMKNTIPPIAHQMPCMECGLMSDKLTWIEYRSSSRGGGRIGNMSVCPNCKEEIQFDETLHYSCEY